MLKELMAQIRAGEPITREQALSLYEEEPTALSAAADTLRWEFCGSRFDMCTIVNGKSGQCSENCKFCAQSSHYQGEAETYSLLDGETLLEQAQYNEAKGVLRFAVVTSGKRLSDRELEAVCGSYRLMHERTGIALCASHGLLSEEQLRRLKAAGVTRYHNNLESSRRYFPQVCTTHTYDEKIATIRAAQRAGLQVCSGGIIGMGETREDRVDMALQLRELGIRSIPLNVLNPIPGTPFGHLERLGTEEICRTAAVFRFLLPHAMIRMAGGRGLMADKGEAVFRSGANAAISGDMLTTAGIGIDEDFLLLNRLGYEVRR